MDRVMGRADWTLLLPVEHAPVSEAIVDGSCDAGTALVDVGLSRTWRRIDDAVAAAPLVISRIDGKCDVAQLISLVSDGGLVYVECHQRELESTLDALVRSGLDVLAVHGIAPSAASPRRYIPIDSPAALTWYVRDLTLASTPRERLEQVAAVAALRQRPAWALSRVGARFPHAAVVATRGRDTERRTEAVVTSGQDPGSRSVVLAFGDDASEPVSVAKVALRPEAAEATRRESHRVELLRRTLPYSLASAIPRPMGMTSTVVGAGVLETCARGPSLQNVAGRWGRPRSLKLRDLKAAVNWLIDFGNATVVMGGLEPPPWMSVCHEAGELFDESSQVRSMLMEASEHLASSPRCQRSVHVHGDAGPWNLHVGRQAARLGRRRLSVIDWEHDGRRPLLGPPLVDVLYLCTYFTFAVRGVSDRGAEISALIDLFGTATPPDRFTTRVRAVMVDAARRSGLSPQDLLPLAVVLWAGQALDVRARRQRLGSAVGVPGAPEAYLAALATTWERRGS